MLSRKSSEHLQIVMNKINKIILTKLIEILQKVENLIRQSKLSNH